MQKTLTLLTAGLVLGGALVSTKTASATPSGLGSYPSTDVYGAGVFHYDADTYSKGLKENFFTTTGLTYGLGGKAEIGFDYNVGGAATKFGDRITFNAKYKLLDGGTDGISVAAGGWGLGKKSVGNPNIAYVKASKNFSFGRLTGGVAHAFGDNLGPDDTSLALGFDRYITPKLQFCIDYYSGDNGYAGISPVLYYYINDKANFGLGLLRLNNSAANPRTQVYACFDYNFDFAQTTPEIVAPAPAPETTTGEAKN